MTAQIKPRSSPLTMRGLARELGVSESTVSLALRNHPRIPEPRRLSIQRAARKRGYAPNAMAVALAHRRHAGGEVPIQAALAWINNWPNPGELRTYREFDAYWRGATAAAEKFGYRLEEFVLGGEMSVPRLVKILRARHIDGILIPPHRQNPRWGNFPWHEFSTIRFGYSISTPAVHAVTSDQAANALLAFESIRARGYERIGFVMGPNTTSQSWFRAGFLLAQSAVPARLRLPILTIRNSARDLPGAVGSWLERNRVEAILTNVAEIGEFLETSGYRVPRDVALAALSVLDGKADAGIYQNPEEIGRVAVLTVLSLIHDHARGIPEIFRHISISGKWVNGKTLPKRSGARPVRVMGRRTIACSG